MKFAIFSALTLGHVIAGHPAVIRLRPWNTKVTWRVLSCVESSLFLVLYPGLFERVVRAVHRYELLNGEDVGDEFCLSVPLRRPESRTALGHVEHLLQNWQHKRDCGGHVPIVWLVEGDGIENCNDCVRTLFMSIKVVLVVFVTAVVNLGHSQDKTIVVGWEGGVVMT